MTARDPMALPRTPARLWKAAVFGVAVVLAGMMAVVVPPAANPDEAVHVDACRWYEDHLLPPPLDSDDLLYCAYGWSRVYTGELAYTLFGRVGALWRAATGERPPVVVYRLTNTLLLGALLAVMLWLPGPAAVDLQRMAVLVASIPQVLYVFASAGSDGLAIAVASLLFVVAVRQLEQPRRRAWPWVGLLCGVGLAAKPNAWVVIAIALGLVVVAWLRADGRRAVASVLAAVAVALGVGLPVRLAPRLVEPASWQVGVEAMRRHRADADRQPDAPVAEGFRLKQRGEPLTRVAADPVWWGRTGMSLWAMFGFMTTRPPLLVLAFAALLWLGLGATTAGAVWRRRAGLRRPTVWALAAAFAAFATLVAASVLRSWLVDYQPQGRYLLVGVIPLAALLVGVPDERLARVQRVLLAAHVALGWTVSLLLPWQVPPPPVG